MMLMNDEMGQLGVTATVGSYSRKLVRMGGIWIRHLPHTNYCWVKTAQLNSVQLVISVAVVFAPSWSLQDAEERNKILRIMLSQNKSII